MSSDHQQIENHEAASLVATEMKSKPRKEKKTKSPSQDALSLFLVEMEKEPSPEAKIAKAIQFMQGALAQTGSPRFKDFWEARKACLPLFKESLNPQQRVSLWNDYIAISAEARRLKEILDEESSYAVEQIELAIKAFNEDLEKVSHFESQGVESSLKEHLPNCLNNSQKYLAWQEEIAFLNTLAARINGLRKELMRTEMRVRIKNRLFEELSAIGDKVFPKRKELIKSLSDQFESDVNQFITENFNENKENPRPYFILKDEIKMLQNFAKLISLNTHSFSETRQRLSNAWDEIKELEKERKKEISLKKAHLRENAKQVFEKIQELKELCEQENATIEAVNEKTDHVFELMKGLQLSREDVRELKDAIAGAKKPFLDKVFLEKQDKARLEKEKKEERYNLLQDWKTKLEGVLALAKEESQENLEEKRNEIKEHLDSLHLNKMEKLGFDMLFKQLQDIIGDKHERTLMNLSVGDKEALNKLTALLREKKNDRKAIKEQLEGYRKAAGASGFDFEKAMMYSEMIDVEKTRLEKVNHAISELEEKIKQLKGA